MVFDDIVGQKNVIRNLKNAIENNRIAHAYLFYGPDGVGKSMVASIFASTLNCKKKGLDPCGCCSSCIKADGGNHPDIIHFEVKKRSGGKQTIGVDDIRDLQMDMLKKPYENGVKVYIIHDADKMTEQAQNALLKTLEEPPLHVMIIMLVSNMYSLLDTIISRCQIIKFTRATEKDIENYLVNYRSISNEQAKYVAAFSEGIVKRAFDFIDDNQFKKTRDEVIDLSLSIYKGDKFTALSRVDYFLENRDNIDNILDIMISLFRDMMIYKEHSDKNIMINLDHINIIETECGRYSTESLYKIIESIKKAAAGIRYNINYQLLIENMLLSIQEG